MRRDRVLPILELLSGLGIFLGFVVLLLVPASWQLATELPWLLGALPFSFGFGPYPHHVAGARWLTPWVVVVACATLLVCYRWLSARRRS